MSDFLWPQGLQHNRPPCLSPTPRVYSNSRPLSSWCHPTISSSVSPCSFWLQPFPASGSFPVSQLFTPGSQSVGVSASASVLSMNIQDWFPLGLTGFISLLSKGLSRVFSNTTRCWTFFMVQLSHPYMTTGKIIAMTIQTLSVKWSLVFNTLSRFLTAFLPRSKRLLISWLQSPSAAILEPKKIKSVTVSLVSPSICHEEMRLEIITLVFECWVLSQLYHSPLSLSSRGSSDPLCFLT